MPPAGIEPATNGLGNHDHNLATTYESKGLRREQIFSCSDSCRNSCTCGATSVSDCPWQVPMPVADLILNWSQLPVEIQNAISLLVQSAIALGHTHDEDESKDCSGMRSTERTSALLSN